MYLCLARLHKVNNGDWKQSVASIAIKLTITTRTCAHCMLLLLLL